MKLQSFRNAYEQEDNKSDNILFVCSIAGYARLYTRQRTIEYYPLIACLYVLHNVCILDARISANTFTLNILALSYM